MSTIRVVARLIARPGKVEAMQEALQGLIAPTRREAGCITYELLQNRSDPTDFTFVEEWASEPSLDAHLRSPHVQGALVHLADLAAMSPDIQRYDRVG
ncbi:MAG TPA: putative quinol monooxygenase [Candidatus Krumholzibacteria bacterium]|nr:putative quinol monooxygenase [Candidatus Krumholzibacteria bacterium]